MHDPIALCIADDRRTLFVAEAANHRIRTIRLDTGIIATFAGDGSQQYSGDLLNAGVTSLSTPHGVAITALNLLFISDTGHHIVYRTTLDAVPAP